MLFILQQTNMNALTVIAFMMFNNKKTDLGYFLKCEKPITRLGKRKNLFEMPLFKKKIHE